MIKLSKRSVLWLLPMVVFLTSPLWKPFLVDFLRPRGTIDQSLEEESNQEQVFSMDEVEITMSRAGKKEWHVTAEQAGTGESGDQELVLRVVRAVYKGGEDPVIITSKQGNYFMAKRELVLKDDVVVNKPVNSEELHTELLYYYDVDKMITCPEQVRIINPDVEITAGRLDYDLATDSYEFSNRVKVIL